MFETILFYVEGFCAIVAFLAIIIKPVREWLLGTEDIREGQRCILRAEIVRIYYRNLEKETLREYEYKLVISCYKAYKRLKGNSFIDHIVKQMEEWEVRP